MIVQSTAVIIRIPKLGKMQDLPAGSGNLEIRMSPGYTSSQRSLLSVSSEIHFLLFSLSKYSVMPIFPVWINLTPELL